jgi:rhodanese-related sulfurtransferase
MALHDTAGTPHPGGFKDLAPTEVPVPAQGFLIVDVREPHEFVGELGHLPGAQLVPMGTLLAAASSWQKDQELLLVCKSGGRSASCAQALATAGFKKVMNLQGGMLGWNAQGLKTER